MNTRQGSWRAHIACFLIAAVCTSFAAAGTPEPIVTVPIGAVVQHAALSSDGERLAVACMDGTVRLLETETWDLVWERTVDDTSGISAVAFWPDGTRIVVTIAGRADVVFLSASTGRELRRLDLYNPTTASGDYNEDVFIRIGAMALSPDGALVACGCASGHVKLVDTVSGDDPIVIRHRVEHGSCSLAFSPNGDLLASYGLEESVVIGTETLEEVASPARPGVRKNTNGMMVFSPDGSLLAMTAGKQGGPGGPTTSVLVYDTEAWAMTRLTVSHDGLFGAVAFSPDGALLAAAGGQKLTIWDTDGFGLTATYTIPTYRRGGVVWMAFTPDGQFLLVAGGNRGYLEVWRVSDLTGA
jgi:WD40 repeat protein